MPSSTPSFETPAVPDSREATNPKSRQSAAFWLPAALLAALALWLAVTRIYQVDEAQNLYMAKVIAMGQTGSYFSNALLWMLGPLSWLIRSVGDSASLFLAGRLLFLGLFCLNIWLLALATGVSLRSAEGRFALLGAATLAPLWDYGFEIRHDNLILTGLLLIWWLGRVRAGGIAGFAAIGFVTALLVFVAFKAFAYAVPLSAALALFAPGGRGRRLPLLALWLGGLAAGAAVAMLAYRVSGLWEVFLAGLPSRGDTVAMAASSRFGPGLALERLPAQTPLLLGLAAGALLAWGREPSRGRAPSASRTSGAAPWACSGSIRPLSPTTWSIWSPFSICSRSVSRRRCGRRPASMPDIWRWPRASSCSPISCPSRPRPGGTSTGPTTGRCC
jgi:hypothetical protein